MGAPLMSSLYTRPGNACNPEVEGGIDPYSSYFYYLYHFALRQSNRLILHGYNWLFAAAKARGREVRHFLSFFSPLDGRALMRS